MPMKNIRFHFANLAKHGVTPEEVQECLRAVRTQYRHRLRERIYRVVGQTLAGRYLEVLYEVQQHEIFVFHAMDARVRDFKLLKRKRKHR
jgi:uncharacterized DUF497 family protein